MKRRDCISLSFSEKARANRIAAFDLTSSARHHRQMNAAMERSALTSSLAKEAAARQLIHALVVRGVDTFFGIPGGPACALFEAIRLTPEARLIESRHETHAAFSAAMYQRATGRVPAVIVTAGPGATNTVTGITSAYLDRVPMLLIVGDVAWASTGRRMAQDSGPEGIHVEAIFAPITRTQIRATSAANVLSQALAALDVACDSQHPGPALFVLPLDYSMTAVPALRVAMQKKPVVADAPQDAVLSAAKWLAEAKRPLIVFGAGCRGHEASISALADAFNIPFVTTPAAKGMVSEEHPRSLRNGGLAASWWARRYTAEPVDSCLVLGSDLDDSSIGPTPYIGRGGKLVHVDFDARVFGRNFPAALGVRACVGAFADALTKRVVAQQLVNPYTNELVEMIRSESPFDVNAFEHDDATPIRPHRLLADVRNAVPANARFITDIGEHMLFAMHYLAASPNSFYVQLNLGSMGSGIAGAIGLALGDPSRLTICIAGDGGMHMAGMEALVAIRERLPILFVVFNDGRYNMVHHGMRQIFGEALDYDMPPVDFAAWAAAIGLPAMTVTRPGEITAAAIQRLLGHGVPALIDARIDRTVRIRGGGRVEALQQMSMSTPERAQQ